MPADAGAVTDGHQVDLDVGSNTITVTVTAEDGTTTRTYTVTVTRAAATNNAPEFSAGATATRNLQETVGDATVSSAADLGAAFTATDDDSDTLTYSLEGADAGNFTVNANTGQLRTKAGVNYDHEAKSSQAVTVKVDDGNGGTDTIAVTVNVTDRDEPPVKPDGPSVSAMPGSATSLGVAWTAAGNAGRPAIQSYDLQYREGTSGSWSNGPQNRTGTSAAISGLDEETAYQVRVRATNAEGDGPWSEPGSGRTAAPGGTP